MKERSLFLTILLWCEVILAARVLLFVGAIFTDKIFTKATQLTLEEWFIASFAIPSLFYFVVGILSLSNVRFWRLLQYLVILMTWVLSGVFLTMVNNTQSAIHVAYFVPAAVSVMLLIGLIVSRK